MNSQFSEQIHSSAHPLVSVITPTYNGARFIAETVDSALGQDYSRLEIIVADDGSTDETLEVLRPYRGRVTVLELPHRGENAARKDAFAASHGEYIAFLDHDDLWLPAKISRQVEALEAHPEVGLCHTAWETFGEEGPGKVLIHRDHGMYHGRCFDTIFHKNGVGALTAVIRRGAFPPHVIHEDIQITADYALWLDVLFHHEAFYIPEVLARHRLHPSQITHGRRVQWKIYESVSRMRLLERVRGNLAEDRYEELRQWTLETLREVTYELARGRDDGWAGLGFYLLRKYGVDVPLADRVRAVVRDWAYRVRGAGGDRRYLKRPA